MESHHFSPLLSNLENNESYEKLKRVFINKNLCHPAHKIKNLYEAYTFSVFKLLSLMVFNCLLPFTNMIVSNYFVETY